MNKRILITCRRCEYQWFSRGHPKGCAKCRKTTYGRDPEKTGPKQSPGQKSLDIIKFRELNPCLEGSAIARKFGLSKERVRQILSKAGMRTTSIKYGTGSTCPVCGGWKAGKVLCSQCRDNKNQREKWIDISCSSCGKLKRKRVAQMLYQLNKMAYKHFFCSRICLGKWVGEHYGFKAHPEKTRFNILNK